MTRSPHGSTPSGNPRYGAALLLFAMLGGQAFYAVHLVASFWLVPVACVTRDTTPLHLVTAATLPGALASTAVAVWCWRTLRPLDERDHEGEPPTVEGGLARAYLNALLLRRGRLAAGLLAAAALWSRSPSERDDERGGVPAAPGRAAFMALTGLLLGLLAIALIAFHWAGVFFFDPCL